MDIVEEEVVFCYQRTGLWKSVLKLISLLHTQEVALGFARR